MRDALGALCGTVGGWGRSRRHAAKRERAPARHRLLLNSSMMLRNSANSRSRAPFPKHHSWVRGGANSLHQALEILLLETGG